MGVAASAAASPQLRRVLHAHWVGGQRRADVSNQSALYEFLRCKTRTAGRGVV